MVRVGAAGALFLMMSVQAAAADALDAPTPPTDFQVGEAAGGVLANWDLPFSNGSSSILGYRLYFDGELVIDLPASVFSYTHATGSLDGTYGVTAYNDEGESPASISVYGIDVPRTPPVLGDPVRETLAYRYPHCGAVTAECLYPPPPFGQ